MTIRPAGDHPSQERFRLLAGIHAVAHHLMAQTLFKRQQMRQLMTGNQVTAQNILDCMIVLTLCATGRLIVSPRSSHHARQFMIHHLIGKIG